MTIVRTFLSYSGKMLIARVSTWWTAFAIVLMATVGIAQRIPQQPDAVVQPSRQESSTLSRQRLDSPRLSDISGLPPAAEARISAAIGAVESEYHVIADRRGFRMKNTSHVVSAEFTSEGVRFYQGANHWGMTLRAYGYGDTLRETHATAPDGTANRVKYARGPLTEWYVNGPLGLEQGFTLERAPGHSNGEPLTVAFALSGNLSASVDPGERGLTLRNDGAAALRYSGLTAWDADGRELRTWLEVAGSQLRVRVDDTAAPYPLTIDPFVQGVKLTSAVPCSNGVCNDGGAGDALGWSVGMSADASTAVVGVPYKVTNGVTTGAAYVFLKPSDQLGGWNSIVPVYFATKLLASDAATGSLRLGWSVAISGDGETIAAGARGVWNGTTTPPGAAYVFVRPTNGWGSASVQTETGTLRGTRRTFDEHNGSFGASITISGNGQTIVVGVPDHQFAGEHRGMAYIYQRPGAGWLNRTEDQKIDGTLNAFFGTSVSLNDDGGILVVGEPGRNPFGVEPNNIGRAGVYAYGAGGLDLYGRVSNLFPSDGVPGDYFGYSVSANANGSVIVVGAPVVTFGSLAHQGAAYVFERPSTGWGSPNFDVDEIAKLTASDGYPNDSFGVSVNVSLDGNTILAGAHQRPIAASTSTGAGAAYLFAKPLSGWSTSTESEKVIASDGMFGELFGFSTALSGDGTVALVGEPAATVGGNAVQGAAYVFTGSFATPTASVSPSNLTFGPRTVSTTSSPQTITVANSGTAPLHVTSVGVTGQFTSTQNCVSASPIPPGGSCSESVAFAPLSVGLLTGALTFTDDSGGASGATQQVQLQGEGQKANTSTTIVSVSNPVFVGQPVIVSFSVAPEPGVTLTPLGSVTVLASTGESCTNDVQTGSCSLIFTTVLDRTITATYNGNMEFNPSASTSVLVRLADFSLSASPSSLSVAGRKATYSLNVAALNGFTGALSLSCSGGAVNTTCAVSPSSVTLSGPTVKAKATLTLPVGASAGTYTVTFTATHGSLARSTTAGLIVK
jgi:hypothetical protein